MSKMKVFDEKVLVDVLRGGEELQVMFCEVQDGDVLRDCGGAVVDGDSHISADASYDGWLFFDTAGNDYFPEDFGSELKEVV